MQHNKKSAEDSIQAYFDLLEFIRIGSAVDSWPEFKLETTLRGESHLSSSSFYHDVMKPVIERGAALNLSSANPFLNSCALFELLNIKLKSVKWMSAYLAEMECYTTKCAR